MEREFDIVLFGATGFTGQLTANHLVRHHLEGGLKLALAGRDEKKLQRVRADVTKTNPLAASLPILVCDAHDEAALMKVASRTKVVLTTVGPYAKHGEKLVGACAKNGTHYADLTGEVTFMRRMIDQHHAEAQRTGARIVHTCGYDSVPSDLGTWLAVREYQKRFGELPDAVLHAAGESRGGASGGTIASMLFLMEEAEKDKSIRRLLANPYSLVDGPSGRERGRDKGDPMGVVFRPELGLWSGPFVMAAVNSRVVRRTNALLQSEGHQGYGDAGYTECMSTGKGAKGLAAATALAAGMGAGLLVLGIGASRRFVAKQWLPKPGEGPSVELQRTGFFVSRFAATGRAGMTKVTMRGEGDPGYAGTARMIGESAMCLAKDNLDSPGGIRTPASTMPEQLLARLKAQRFTFDVA